MENNKKIFEEPKLDVIEFSEEDVIATSLNDFESDNGPETGNMNIFK